MNESDSDEEIKEEKNELLRLIERYEKLPSSSADRLFLFFADNLAK